MYLDPFFRAAASVVECHYLLLYRLDDRLKYPPKSLFDVCPVVC